MDDQQLDTDLISENNSKPPIGFGMGIALALLLILGQVIGVVLGAIAVFAIQGVSEDSMSLIMMTGMIIGFPIGAYLVLRFNKLDNSVLSWSNSYLLLLVFGLMMTYGVSYIIGGMLEYLPGYDDLLDQYTSMFEGLNPALLFIAGGIIGPICEELIFRGVILKEALC